MSISSARTRAGLVFLCAFDLLELNGKDRRREPLEVRKSTLDRLRRPRRSGLQFKRHLTHLCDVVFRHACAMGLKGVSKRLGSRYVSGRYRDWLKFKNPEAPGVKREADEIEAG